MGSEQELSDVLSEVLGVVSELWHRTSALASAVEEPWRTEFEARTTEAGVLVAQLILTIEALHLRLPEADGGSADAAA